MPDEGKHKKSCVLEIAQTRLVLLLTFKCDSIRLNSINCVRVGTLIFLTMEVNKQVFPDKRTTLELCM